MATVREQILDAIETAYGGSDDVLRLSIIENYAEAKSAGFLKAVIPDDETAELDNYGRYTVRMPIAIERLEILEVPAINDWRERQSLLAKKAQEVMGKLLIEFAGKDKTWDGLAVTTKYTGGGAAIVDEASNVCAGFINIEVIYKFLANDPESAS